MAKSNKSPIREHVEPGASAKIDGIDVEANPFVHRVDLDVDRKRAFCTTELTNLRIVPYEEYLRRPCPDCRIRELERQRAAAREAAEREAWDENDRPDVPEGPP